MFKKIISTLLFSITLISSSNAMVIDRPYISYPEYMGDVKLIHDDSGFMIERNGKLSEVKNCFVDKSIRNMDSDMLSFFLGTKKLINIRGEFFIFEKASKDVFEESMKYMQHKANLSQKESTIIDSKLAQSNYIKIIELSDGNIALHTKMRLPGGGPITGLIAYWITKVGCYATAAAALTTATVATGGVVGGITGAAAAGAGVATAAAVGSTVAATAAGIVGAGAAGISTAAATGAAVATGSVIAGGVTAAIAAVETASTAAGLFFGCIPFLP